METELMKIVKPDWRLSRLQYSESEDELLVGFLWILRTRREQ